jgi:alpha-L-arabinofuranosidase
VNGRSAIGEVLTAAAVDSHNSVAAPAVVAPRAFAGRAGGGGIEFELPPKSVAVVEVR